MKTLIKLTGGLAIAAGLTLITAPLEVTYAQEGAEELEEVVVTGSRIRRDPLTEPTAIMELDRSDIVNSGKTNLGDALQNLPITGSAPNASFNVPGNSGFPSDGAGIGAGSVQLSLRNVEAKRTLVLVDGKRWVAGASASGVPGTVDLNTIPDNMIQRVEILQDGASAIYGSDAIGGVVNIITDQAFEGFRMDAQTGAYLSDSDGEQTEFGLKWGGGNGTTHVVMSASYREEKGIETSARARSAFPNPDATSCDIPGSFCSSFIPQGRFGVDGVNWVLNDGVVNDGITLPVYNPADPANSDFHVFAGADTFNYNASGFNYIRTPNERVNLFASARHDLGNDINLFGVFSYTNRTSATKAAPEPLMLGAGGGTAISEAFFISGQNRYNPFGMDLSVALGNLSSLRRRPLEDGGRLFFQDTNSYMTTVGIEGEFASSGGKNFYWEAYASYGDNRGFQEKYNSHNLAKLQIAMGDPAVCAATPNCVEYNFFGGQGANGEGSITDEMRDFVNYTQRDFSEQTLANYAFNISGDLFDLPAGTVGFAAGLEYRDHQGSFRPDPIAANGETAGIPSGPTEGGFDVTEFYGELNIPLLDNGNQYWEVNAAARNSDYSTFGNEATYKVSTLFQPIQSVSLRASVSTGFRAPNIGELFGGAAREDFTFLDPCSDVLGLVDPAIQGRALPDGPGPQSQLIQDNCAALGVPTSFVQGNPSLSARSQGNPTMSPETSDSITFGAVWSSNFDASWISGLTASIDFYDLEIEDAVASRDPRDVLTQCVDTLDPLFCDLTPRIVGGGGVLDVIDNQIQNIGGIEASGYDIMVGYASPSWGIGDITATLNATFLSDYTESNTNIDGTTATNDRTGTHTNETFQRAFPELRWTTNIGWAKNRWSGNLAFRYTDEMTLDGGSKVDSVIFTDLRVSYNPSFFSDGMAVTLGFNNILDEDPPVCFPCGVIGMSIVTHDLPGRVGYLRVSYQMQ